MISQRGSRNRNEPYDLNIEPSDEKERAQFLPAVIYMIESLFSGLDSFSTLK